MSAIKNWYKNQNVLITGATGFVGKVLVEKLLRECSELKTMYLLMRSNRKLSLKERSEKFVEHFIFDRIRKENAFVLNKIKIIESDLSAPQLGISEANLVVLKANTNIILHCAANVKFDQKMVEGYETNFCGTRSLLTLAHDIPDLKVFVYVSTSFSQSNSKNILEKHYTSPIGYEDIIKIMDKHKNNLDILDALSHKILGDFPNFYSFFKSITEDYVFQHRRSFPITIVRPSIVVAALSDPLPNYIEGFQSISGYTIASGTGLLRSLNIDPEIQINFVPVDVVANTIIIASWIQATRNQELTYYNCSDSIEHCPIINAYITSAHNTYLEFPFDYSFFYPQQVITKNKIHHYSVLLFKQILPAILFDTILKLCGKKAVLLSLQRKVYYMFSLLYYYLREDQSFSTTNFQALDKHLNAIDSKIYNINLNDITTESSTHSILRGCRIYLLKQNDEDMERSKIVLSILKWISIVFHTIFVVYLLSRIWSIALITWSNMFMIMLLAL